MFEHLFANGKPSQTLNEATIIVTPKKRRMLKKCDPIDLCPY